MKGAQVSSAPPADVSTPAEPAAGVQLVLLQLALRIQLQQGTRPGAMEREGGRDRGTHARSRARTHTHICTRARRGRGPDERKTAEGRTFWAQEAEARSGDRACGREPPALAPGPAPFPAPPPRVLSAARGRAALGARRRRRGLIAGALAPPSLRRPLRGLPGGWRRQARREQGRGGAASPSHAGRSLGTPGPRARPPVSRPRSRPQPPARPEQEAGLAPASAPSPPPPPRGLPSMPRGLRWGLGSSPSRCFGTSVVCRSIKTVTHFCRDAIVHTIRMSSILFICFAEIDGALKSRTSWRCHLYPATYKLWPWLSVFPFLCISLLLCKMGERRCLHTGLPEMLRWGAPAHGEVTKPL